MDTPEKITVIKPTQSWSFPDFKEVYAYRDLIILFLYRDIKSRYAQSILGFGWAFIQPLFRIIIFSVIFGKMAKVNSEGTPYILYSSIAIIPWTFFTNSLSTVSGSLNSFASMLTKVYFPRIIIPIAGMVSRLIDLSISFSIILGMIIWFKTYPGWQIIFVPFLIIMTMLSSFGLGLWLTSLGIKYRDINYSMQFFIQLGMYLSPVVYGLNQIPEKYRILYSLNPMVGILESFRSIFLQTNPIPWDLLGMGTITTIFLLATGLLKFKQTERIFADIV